MRPSIVFKKVLKKVIQIIEVNTVRSLETFAQQLDTNINQLIGAEYDDVDCGECLYTVRNERYDKLWGESRNFALYFKSSSPQMAFLKAYEFSREKRFRWFESRDRAIVKLVGVPVKKTDYANKFKPIDAKADDLI